MIKTPDLCVTGLVYSTSYTIVNSFWRCCHSYIAKSKHHRRLRHAAAADDKHSRERSTLKCLYWRICSGRTAVSRPPDRPCLVHTVSRLSLTALCWHSDADNCTAVTAPLVTTGIHDPVLTAPALPVQELTVFLRDAFPDISDGMIHMTAPLMSAGRPSVSAPPAAPSHQGTGQRCLIDQHTVLVWVIGAMPTRQQRSSQTALINCWPSMAAGLQSLYKYRANQDICNR